VTLEKPCNLIIKGEVSVIKSQGEDNEIELDRISAGDYFGEMALFEDIPRSATIRTEQESRLLVLHKQEFNEIVREYPRIALNICKVLSGRIRKLTQKDDGLVVNMCFDLHLAMNLSAVSSRLK